MLVWLVVLIATLRRGCSGVYTGIWPVLVSPRDLRSVDNYGGSALRQREIAANQTGRESVKLSTEVWLGFLGNSCKSKEGRCCGAVKETVWPGSLPAFLLTTHFVAGQPARLCQANTEQTGKYSLEMNQSFQRDQDDGIFMHLQTSLVEMLFSSQSVSLLRSICFGNPGLQWGTVARWSSGLIKLPDEHSHHDCLYTAVVWMSWAGISTLYK